MSNRIGSIEDKQLVSIINDSDRYKDISLLIYEQNRDLYNNLDRIALNNP